MHKVIYVHNQRFNLIISQSLNGSDTNLFAKSTTLSLVLPPLISLTTAALQPFQLSLLFIRHPHMHVVTPSLQPQNSWLWLFLPFQSRHLEPSPPRCAHYYYSFFKPSPFLFYEHLNWATQSFTPNIECVCVCVCVHVHSHSCLVQGCLAVLMCTLSVGFYVNK